MVECLGSMPSTARKGKRRAVIPTIIIPKELKDVAINFEKLRL
jgi:hypothetical protein